MYYLTPRGYPAGMRMPWAERNCNPGRAGARFLEFYQAILEKTRGAGG